MERDAIRVPYEEVDMYTYSYNVDALHGWARSTSLYYSRGYDWLQTSWDTALKHYWKKRAQCISTTKC